MGWLDACYNEGVPQRVKFVAAVVHHAAQVGVHLLGAQADAVIRPAGLRSSSSSSSSDSSDSEGEGGDS
jgi:hypothetical protein